MNTNAPSDSLRSQAIAHFHRKDYATSLACFDRYLSTHPADRDLYNFKARAFEALGQWEESLRCLDQCLALDPDNIAELGNRALMLTKLSRRAEALETLDKVVRLQPDHVDGWIRRAVLLHQLNRREEALRSAEQAVTIAPQHFNALNTRGMILDDLGYRDQALADFRAILAIDANYADAITNHGILYARRGQFHEALACYDRSLALDPHQLNAFYNRAVIRLVLGDWPRGFREFECRWKLFPHEAARLTRLAPMWTGQVDVAGKTILLHHEQGYGDTLQFCRYVRLVAQRGARVILAAPAGVRRLMETLPGAPMIVSEGEPVPAHDYHCPLMSLPLVFGTTPDTVPAPVPYLSADPDAVKAWSDKLGPRPRPRIGVVWSGRRYPPINVARDMTLDAVRPLFNLNADFICLHTELSEEERTQLASLTNVRWLGGGLSDFADTAALMENLDLLITVDTAVAHLAGALGKPVWLMNRYASCWRWLLTRTDSPWYPTMRLFRQPAFGDWAGVIREVQGAAKAFVEAHTPKALTPPGVSAGSIVLPSEFLEVFQHALDHHNRGELTEAVSGYRHLLDSEPHQADVLHYLGVALAQIGLHEEALIPLSQAAELQPHNATVHNHYGNALVGLSRHGEAIASYERAMACDDRLADSHYNCGLALTQMGRLEEALARFSRAVELNPDYAQAHNVRGNVLLDLGKSPEALECYERALAVRPELIDAWINRAHLLRRLHRYEESLASSDRAIAYDAAHAQAHNVRGAALAGLGRRREALASYERAIELDPSLPEAVWNKSLIKLTDGDLLEGWALYESRWRVKSLKLIERFPHRPPWRGTESVDGKVVLLHAEQGYGDTIQFSRYAALVAARGARVILSVPTALKSLSGSLPGVAEVVTPESAPAFDYHCSLMSLPLALGTELSTIPAPRRYLQAEASAVARWADRIAEPRGVPRVGIVWSGRSTHTNDFNRSLPIQALGPLLDIDAQWISLQKELRPADGEHLATVPAVQRFCEEIADFADTAALIENLDLIISVDTAVAHLAGALGKPVWILLPHVADWRWLREREDSPWYPSARLYRQSAPGNWAPVIDRVMGELRAFRKMLHRGASPAIGESTGISRARPRKQGRSRRVRE